MGLTESISALLESGTLGMAAPLLPEEIRHDIGSLETYYQAFAAFALSRSRALGASLRRFIEETKP